MYARSSLFAIILFNFCAVNVVSVKTRSPNVPEKVPSTSPPAMTAKKRSLVRSKSLPENLLRSALSKNLVDTRAARQHSSSPSSPMTAKAFEQQNRGKTIVDTSGILEIGSSPRYFHHVIYCFFLNFNLNFTKIDKKISFLLE